MVEGMENMEKRDQQEIEKIERKCHGGSKRWIMKILTKY